MHASRLRPHGVVRTPGLAGVATTAALAAFLAALLTAPSAAAQEPERPAERPAALADEEPLPAPRPAPEAEDAAEDAAGARPDEPASEAGPPLERPAGATDEALLPIPRPTPPATEGETEVEIEAEAQPEDPPAPLEPEPEPAPDAALPGPLPRPADAATGEPSRPDPGWTLRQATGTSPVALGGGPGQIVSVAAFCLGGSPWLALELFPAPEAASVRADFGFTETRVEAEALREDGAGGAYVIELADSPLAGLLAGSDSVAALGLDGTQQGPLSLAGSTRTIRAALEDCHAF